MVAPDAQAENRGFAPPLDSRLVPSGLRPGVVERERLLRRLRAAPGPRVHVVHAPPGYGKSTLAAQFATSDRRDVAWLTLDAADADPVRLVADLAFALGHGPDAGPDALPRLMELLSHSQRGRVIVLDDIHHATTPEARDVLAAIVDHVPPGSTLVLVGRARPKLSLARLVAAGRLDVITAKDLKMTVGEGHAMLRGLGIGLDAQEAELVVRRTEGWPAALYLVSLTMREGAELDDQALGGDVVEYLRDEVLQSIDHDDVRFLLDASILDELTPGDCDAVLGRTDCAARLESLAAGDVFVTALDVHGGSYRIHGLFRDALQARLEQVDPRRARVLHRRAATHFEQHRQIEKAIRHALAAGESQTAADLVWRVTAEYESRGESATLTRWLGWFSHEDVVAHPCLALTGGWIGIDTGDGDAAEHWTSVARAAQPGLVLCTGEPMAAHVLLLEAALGHGGVKAIGEAATAADLLLPEPAPLRALARMLAGTAAYLQGDVSAARAPLLDAQTAAAAKLPTVYGLALAQLALIAIDDDDWDEAEACMARVWLDARGVLRDYVSMALCCAVDGLIRAHRGEQFAAREVVADARRALEAQRHYASWFAAEVRVVLAAASLALGSVAEARAMAAEARHLAAHDHHALGLHRGLAKLDSALERAAGVTAGDLHLTGAELSALELLATHLSQREIADRLIVTRSTIHTHAQAIYRKLEVSSRSEAVARAHELGLLKGSSPILVEVR